MSATDGLLPSSMRRIDPNWYEGYPERRRQLIEWFNDHGVNASAVLRDARIEFPDDNYLEIEVYDMPSGLPEWDRETGKPKTRWLKIQIARPFPMECVS